MRILTTYLINDNTQRIMPIVAEDGNVYTLIFETEHMAIIDKPPAEVIEESNLFYMQPPSEFYLKRKWGSLAEKNGKSIHANFHLTFKSETKE